MCGYDCAGCGACFDSDKGSKKWSAIKPRGRCAECGRQNTPSATKCIACGAILDPYISKHPRS